MSVTLQDMLDALKAHPLRAREAIFWFCHMWNAGPGSVLYRIMCETNYDPSLYELRGRPGYVLDPTYKPFLNPTTDPEIVECHIILTERWVKAFGWPSEYPLRPILFDEIKENDVVVCGPGRQFPCIEADWPCRVFLNDGKLGVPCAESRTKRSFHPFQMGPYGLIVGFRR